MDQRQNSLRWFSLLILAGFGLAASHARAATGGPDAFGYSFADQDSGTRYQYIDIRTTGTLLGNGDDTLIPAVTLGAPFTFYGSVVTQLRPSTNGFITSTTGSSSDLSNDCPTPSVAGGGGFRIAVYHDDLITSVYHRYLDAAAAAAAGYPGETEGITVFQWVGEYWPSGGGDTIDVEAILFHDDDSILTMVASATNRGASSTLGIQNATGTVGIGYTCNSTARITPGVTAVRYAGCGNGSVGGLEQCDDGGASATCDADCTFATCGDSTLNTAAGETCDTGGGSATCDVDCTAPACGDAVANAAAGEACDDGGDSATCDADCTLATCGDAFVNLASGEACDDAGESATCNADCTSATCGDAVLNTTAGEVCDAGGESASCDVDCTAPVCGDSVANASAGEACDDGGASATCDADCTVARCGDALLNALAGETCDDGGESAACDVDCSAASCGDALLNASAGEACDDGGASATCDADCTAASCGDLVVNAAAGETCDDGGESATCDVDCTSVSCGDAVTNTTAGETCDDGGESATCNADCTAARCGDGIVNATAGEACDDGNTDLNDACAPDCTSLTVCVDGEYESAAPTATSDRVCTACTVCDAGQIEVSACTATTDTVCAAGDAGMATDAGARDAGVSVGDGGPSDGGPRDGGSGSDGSIAPVPATGCGCSVPRERSSHGALACLIGLALLVSRRHRR